MVRLRLIHIDLSRHPIVKSVVELTERERRMLLNEVLACKGLMPLLMKPRNMQRWTREDKAELMRQLRYLTAVSPYLVLLVMPGGFIMMFALARWLDRRRGRRLALLPPAPST